MGKGCNQSANCRVDQITFRRYAYTLVEKRRLRNRWRRGALIEMDLIVPVLNGALLVDALRHDCYPGIPARFVEPLATQWNGPPEYRDDEGRAVIIDGGCGVAECCGVLADISFDESTVTWSQIGIGLRASDLRDYVFDRLEYETAIAGIASLQPIPVRAKT